LLIQSRNALFNGLLRGCAWEGGTRQHTLYRGNCVIKQSGKWRRVVARRSNQCLQLVVILIRQNTRPATVNL
jgi:hypothetical protein